MPIISFATATAHAMLDAVTTKIDAGTTAGKVRIYSGTRPANANTALSANTVLAELVCSDPSAPAAAGNALTFSAITQDVSADATGTASFFRILDSNDLVVMQGDVTVAGGGGALELNTLSIVASGPVQITSASFTLA